MSNTQGVRREWLWFEIEPGVYTAYIGPRTEYDRQFEADWKSRMAEESAREEKEPDGIRIDISCSSDATGDPPKIERIPQRDKRRPRRRWSLLRRISNLFGCA